MALFGGLDKTKHFSEFGDPLQTAKGVLTASARKAAALANLGLTALAAEINTLAGVVAGTVTASKAVVVDANKDVASFRNLTTTGALRAGTLMRVQAAPAAKTTDTTLTAAELLGGIITGNQGGGAGATYTLPLATDLETALLALYPTLGNNDSFDFFVINLSTAAAEDITIATNTGWTLVGSMLVIEQAAGNPAGSNGQFRVRRTGANAYTLYRIA